VIFSAHMGKRIFLFLLTNLAIVLTLSIVLSVLGVGRYIGPDGKILEIDKAVRAGTACPPGGRPPSSASWS